MKTYLLTWIICCLAYDVAFSQILRVDKNHLESDSAGYFTFNADISFTLDNRSITPEEKLVYTRLSTKGDLLFVSKKNAYILINSIEYVSSTNAIPFSTGFSHFRVNFRREHALSFEAYAQIQYDEVRRMRFRILGGGGLRYTFIDEDGFDAHIGTGVMYEHEKWSETEEVNSAILYKEMPKSSSYVGVEFFLSKHVKFDLWGLYQVGYDWEYEIYRNRYAAEVALNFIIGKRLTWVNRLTYFYDAQPVIPINPA
ncbi:MAG: DUF481 domain-containing protein, partial [Cyclobacteriaceae bacterium]|nr:DUF481 domain-containing protein [Cyclobacteriaceae bacterium]